jgi:SPX domain protein involved in polyphosphate accumulation
MITSAFRYERKFFINDLTYKNVESIIKLNPFQFSEIFHLRNINNIYYDTLFMHSLNDNILGISDRLKVRVRWYGDLFGEINEPTLELKIKKGQVGKKHSIKINPFRLEIGEYLHPKCPLISNYSNQINYDLNNYKPTLINSYQRKYFLSKDKMFRVTIDSNQTFIPISMNVPIKKISDKTSIIVELKYGDKEDDKARNLSDYFPFRLSKSSKYVRGLSFG